MKRVLIVDDEPPIRQMIGDVLRDEGYGVLFAGSGRSMLTVLETERPDLVLLDLMMPDGDGWEALQTLQTQPQLRAIPVVIVSSGFLPHRLDGVSAPFLFKPFDLEQLLGVITQAIGPATESPPS